MKTGIKILLGWEIILSLISFYLIVVLHLKRGKIIKITLLATKDILILICYLLFVSIPLGIFNQGFWQTLWGIKLIIPPIIILYLSFLFSPFLFKEFVEKVMKMYLLLFIPIFAIAILENFLGVSFLTNVLGIPYGKSFLKISHIEGTFRTIATFREPYDFGFFSFIISVFALSRLIKLKRSKIWSCIFLSMGSVALYLSTSRTNIASFVYSIIILTSIFGIMNFIRNSKIKMFLFLLVSTIVVLAIFFLYAYNVFSQSEIPLFSTKSLAERFYVWSNALSSFPINDAFHFLFGYGIGSIGSAQIKVNPYAYNPVDNMYIYSLINFGLVGTILLIGIPLISVKKSVLKIKKLDWIQMGFVLLIASMIFIQGFFVSYAEGLLSWGIFWVGIIYLRISHTIDYNDAHFRQN